MRTWGRFECKYLVEYLLTPLQYKLEFTICSYIQLILFIERSLLVCTVIFQALGASGLTSWGSQRLPPVATVKIFDSCTS